MKPPPLSKVPESGTPQAPIQGRSFLQALDSADAPEFRTRSFSETSSFTAEI